MKRDLPKFNIGQILDIPTGKFCGDEILNGGVALPQFSTGYPRPNFVSNMLAFNSLDDKLRQAKPSTPERYGIAVRLFKLMGLGVRWEDETKAPVVSWFDLEGGMRDFGEVVNDILHKDYTVEELDDESKHANELAERMAEHMFTEPVISLTDFRNRIIRAAQARGDCEGNHHRTIVLDSLSPLS